MSQRRDDALVEKLLADFYHRDGPPLEAQSDGVHMPDTLDLFPYGHEAGVARRSDGWRLDWDEHFDVSAAPAGWGYAGAPFNAAPTATRYTNDSLIEIQAAANVRHFFFTTVTPTNTLRAKIVGIWGNTVGFFVGVRWDDGTDNNYSELGIYTSGVSPTTYQIQYRYQTGGGGVVTVNGNSVPMPVPFVAVMDALGTAYTNWTQRCMIAGCEGAVYLWRYIVAQTPAALAWTPTRIGIVIDNLASANTWHRGLVDAVDWN